MDEIDKAKIVHKNYILIIELKPEISSWVNDLAIL